MRYLKLSLKKKAPPNDNKAKKKIITLTIILLWGLSSISYKMRIDENFAIW